MLTQHGDAASAQPMLAKAAFADSSGGGPQLELTPAEIVIRVDVDARFVAE